MKKIWLMLIFIGLFSGSAFALDQGQFQITTGLNFQDIDWYYDADGNKGDVKDKQNLYTVPLVVEFGILKGFDVRFIALFTVIDLNDDTYKGFNMPALGLKYMYGIIGGSVDVYFPYVAKDFEDVLDKSTRMDFRLYVEPTFGPVKLNFLLDYYGDFGDDENMNPHVITFSARPAYTFTSINLTLAFGVQLDYFFLPNKDSGEKNGYMLSFEPALEYKIGSMVKLGLAFPVGVLGKYYSMFGSETLANNLLVNYAGYGVKMSVSVLF